MNTEDALKIARTLAEAGVPIFLARPTTIAVQQRINGKPGKVRHEWDPTGNRGLGYVPPKDWQQTVADPTVLDKWEPGMAVCAVMGVEVDALDYDPRNGGSREALEAVLGDHMPTVYGRARTPSGGTHELIAATGLPKGKAIDGVDLQSGAASAQSRGFIFLAPTARLSKTTGEIVRYEWIEQPDFDPFDLELDGSGAALKALRVSRPERSERPEVSVTGPATAQEVADAQSLLAKFLDGIRASEEGNRYHTWWGQARDTVPAVLIYKLVAGGCLDEDEVDRLVLKVAEDADWDAELLADYIETVKQLGREDPTRPYPRTQRLEAADVFDAVGDVDISELGCEDGPALFAEVVERVREYLYLPSEHDYHSFVMWAATTHAIDYLEHATRLTLMSPEKRCGKSRGMDLLKELCARSLSTVNATPAAVFRSITPRKPPTLLFDEVDTIFGTKKAAEGNEDLRGILNAGHARGNPVLRAEQVKGKWVVVHKQVFAPAALAGIGRVPDTIGDRAVEIDMCRRPNDVAVKPFRIKRDGEGVFRPLGDRIAAWVEAQVASGAISRDTEVTNLGVEDRAADNWESLVMIADAIGGPWPDRARAAAVAKTADSRKKDTDSLSRRALQDVRSVWPEGATRVHSERLAAALRELEESPWASYGEGRRGLDAYQLSRLLKPYGVRTKQAKIDGENQRAYWIEGWCDKGCRENDSCGSARLSDVWASYLDDEGKQP